MFPRLPIPPGYPPTNDLDKRNQNWKDYLNNKDGKRKDVELPSAYPDPSQVTDPGLQMIGAMAQAQGVQYSWGGGKGPIPGPTNGIDGGHGYDNDTNVVGMYCSGLARYAFYAVTGKDPGAGGTWALFDYFVKSGNGKVIGPTNPTDITAQTEANMQPGDIILYGRNGGTHVSVYVGNGVMVQTNESGTSANFAKLDTVGRINPGDNVRAVTLVRPNVFN